MVTSEGDAAFFKRHDSHPQGIYVVEVYLYGHQVATGIFSTQEKVSSFLEQFEPQHNAITIPFIIDHPDFGQTPKGKLL
jgi:hypothetical protein